MVIGLFILSIILIVMLITRYLPVRGVHEIDFINNRDDVIFVDTRDYQTADREECAPVSYRIPLPYVKRQYKQLPDKRIVLIVSDRTEKNLYARLLKRKGFNVIGYINPSESFLTESNKICS